MIVPWFLWGLAYVLFVCVGVWPDTSAKEPNLLNLIRCIVATLTLTTTTLGLAFLFPYLPFRDVCFVAGGITLFSLYLVDVQ